MARMRVPRIDLPAALLAASVVTAAGAGDAAAATFNVSKISSGVAQYGGGVAAVGMVNLHLDRSDVSHNTAWGAGGGVAFIGFGFDIPALFTFSRSSMYNNTAWGEGGAVQAIGVRLFHVDGSTLSANWSDEADEATLYIEDTQDLRTFNSTIVKYRGERWEPGRNCLLIGPGEHVVLRFEQDSRFELRNARGPQPRHQRPRHGRVHARTGRLARLSCPPDPVDEPRAQRGKSELLYRWVQYIDGSARLQPRRRLRCGQLREWRDSVSQGILANGGDAGVAQGALVPRFARRSLSNGAMVTSPWRPPAVYPSRSRPR